MVPMMAPHSGPLLQDSQALGGTPTLGDHSPSIAQGSRMGALPSRVSGALGLLQRASECGIGSLLSATL